MSELLNKLNEKDRKGSKPRCHWLTHGEPTEIAKRLTELIGEYGQVTTDDQWMPKGFDQTDEAELDKATELLPREIRKRLGSWWLAVSKIARTPNFDIASTCTVAVNGESKPGLLLVEAKAHDQELIHAESGKSLEAGKNGISINSRRNHEQIGACIRDANLALADKTGMPWALARDWNYQMSNRFAWAWKLTELGIPVILVYLGFLKAEEMRREGKQKPFDSHNDWEALVKAHSAPLLCGEIWNRPLTTLKQPLIPLIKSLEIAYNRSVED